MTILSTVCLVVAICSMVGGIALMVAMTSAVQARGKKVNWLLLRLFVFKYITQYRSLTVQESGRPGPLFYPFIVLMNSALVFAILGVLLRST